MLTPVELQNKTFKSGGLGYDKKDVEQFFHEVTDEFARLYSENIDLKDKVEALNNALQNYKTMESTLQKALVLAEKTAEDTTQAALKNARNIEKEAQLKSQFILADARNELEHVRTQTMAMLQQFDKYKVQFKSLVAAQMELLESESYSLNADRIEASIDASRMALPRTEEKAGQTDMALLDGFNTTRASGRADKRASEGTGAEQRTGRSGEISASWPEMEPMEGSTGRAEGFTASRTNVGGADEADLSGSFNKMRFSERTGRRQPERASMDRQGLESKAGAGDRNGSGRELERNGKTITDRMEEKQPELRRGQAETIELAKGSKGLSERTGESVSEPAQTRQTERNTGRGESSSYWPDGRFPGRAVRKTPERPEEKSAVFGKMDRAAEEKIPVFPRNNFAEEKKNSETADAKAAAEENDSDGFSFIDL